MYPDGPQTLRKVSAVASIRYMRGQTCAHLLRADDGNAYVTKFCNNPLGERAVVAEYVGSQLLEWVGLPTPVLALVQCNSVLPNIPRGVHVGSCYPGDPSLHAVHDFLPARLYSRVANWKALVAGATVFDIWVANAEVRQLVFTRRGASWKGFLIDNTHLFGGLAWSFESTLETGALCGHVDGNSVAGISEWTERIRDAGVALKGVQDTVPRAWLTPTDEVQLDQVVVELERRAMTIEKLVKEHLFKAQSSKMSRLSRFTASALNEGGDTM